MTLRRQRLYGHIYKCPVTLCLFACAGATAGVAFCRPVPWEALGGNHRSVHSILQRPPPDFKLHKSRHGRQGEWIKINWNNKLSIIHNNIKKQNNNNSQVLAMLVILAWHYRTTALSTIISQTWSSCTSCVLFATNVTKYQNEANFSRVKHLNFGEALNVRVIKASDIVYWWTKNLLGQTL